MSPALHSSARAATVLGLLTVSGCEGCGVPKPDLERMIDQSRYEPFEAAAEFADGRAMRLPPAGTVARDRILGLPALTAGTERGRPVERIPIALSPALLARGRDRFEVFCAVCHGLTGDGTSEVAESMRQRPPPSLHAADVRAFPDGKLYAIVDRGYGLMPAYGAELAIEERWAVVAYVRALQLSRSLERSQLPAALRQEADRWLR